MRTIDWAAHKQHREQVIADHGQWVGIVDEDGIPLWDLPPVMTLTAPEVMNAPESAKGVLQVGGRYEARHPVVDELIADLTDIVSDDGSLSPVSEATRMLVVERAGGYRRAYTVTHTVATGAAAPEQLEINAVGVLDVLRTLPAPSRPDAWKHHFHRIDRDWVKPWEQARDVAAIELEERRGRAVIEGPALQAIHEVIEGSLTAVFRAMGVEDPWPVVVETPASGGPETVIALEDRTIWDTIIPYAAAAGVRVSARLWWPGDPPVPAAHRGNAPTIVIRLELNRKGTP
ncbi:hypothetical protein OS127_02835 [Corynebacterium sp. P6129]|uniref:hypothetical protein n=1 Tax=Corynebacterium antarcticum TaxID=2800405 RepID=UPI002260C1AB|nr:hypothetical protein [Corynebacterium antarcticum]MCX7491465.1 hypothetical protein [Corynebacterium antarcticum]